VGVVEVTVGFRRPVCVEYRDRLSRLVCAKVALSAFGALVMRAFCHEGTSTTRMLDSALICITVIV
jgi:hypothetical protein